MGFNIRALAERVAGQGRAAAPAAAPASAPAAGQAPAAPAAPAAASAPPAMGGPVGRAMRPLSRVVDRALTTMGANGSAAAPAAAAPAITPAPTSTLQPVSRQAAVGKPGLGMQLPSMDGPMTQEGMDSMGDEFSRAWNQHDF